MSAAPILILGGTAEARELAAALEDDGVAVISSLAGRVSNPRLPPGEVRVGGFGGASALARWLREREVGAVVDATHPFAQRISASAVEACAVAGVELLRLERPRWRQRPGDDWRRVANLDAAATLARQLGRRVLLTSGRQGLAAFAGLDDLWFLVRCVDPPEPPLPAHHELLLSRGPHYVAAELALIDRHRIDLVITKDSGGSQTQAKLEAARERGVPVIVVDRPPRPAAPTVASVNDARLWALGRAHSG